MTDPLDDALLDFLYKWDRTEEPLGFRIVDIDLTGLADAHPGSFRSRAETTAALDELAAAVTESTDPYLASKIGAAVAFLSCLNGHVIGWDEYIQRTLGVTPVLIDEADLQLQQNRNAELLSAIGFDHDAAGVKAWFESAALDFKDIRGLFDEADATLVPVVKEAAGIDFEVPYRSLVVDKDVYWINWTSTDENGDVLVEFNVNKRHMWTAGNPQRLALHEVGGHAVQMMSWKRRIAAGAIPKSAGIICVFSPDMLLAEGVADTLWWFCPELPVDATTEWALNRARLSEMVGNNAQYMANHGADVDEVVAYRSRWTPSYRPEENWRTEYDESMNHILLRGYLHSYGIGGTLHQRLAERLSPAGRRAYLRRAYSGPVSAAEIENFSF